MAGNNVYVAGLPEGLDEVAFRQLFASFGTILSCRICPSKKGVGLGYGFVRFSNAQEVQRCIAVMNGFEYNGNKLLVKVANDQQGKGGPEPDVAAQLAAAAAVASAGLGGAGSLGGGLGAGGLAAATAGLAASAVPRAAEIDWAAVLSQISSATGGSNAAALSVVAAAAAQQQLLRSERAEAPLSTTNVYVAGIPEATDEADFRQLFENFGTVLSCKLCTSAKFETKYGFIKFALPDEAQLAINSMQSIELYGTKLTVRLAKEGSGGMTSTVLPLGVAPASTPLAATTGAGAAAPAAAATTPLDLSPAGLAAIANAAAGGVEPGATSASPPTAPAAEEHAIEEVPHWAPPSDNLYIKGLPGGATDQQVHQIFAAYGNVVQVRVLESRIPGVTSDSVALVRMGSLAEATWLVENLNGNIPQGLTGPVIIRFADTPDMKAKRRGKGGACAAEGGLLELAVPDVPASSSVRQNHRYQPYGACCGAAAGTGAGNTASAGTSWSSAASHEFMKAVSETVAKVKGFPSVTNPDGTDPAHLYVAGLPPNADDLYLYNIFSPFGAIMAIHTMRDEQGVCRGIGFVKFGLPSDAELAIATLTGNQLPDGNIVSVSVKQPRRQGK